MKLQSQLAVGAAATRESYRGHQFLIQMWQHQEDLLICQMSAGPLKRKLKVIDSPGRGHSTGGQEVKITKKNILLEMLKATDVAGIRETKINLLVL